MPINRVQAIPLSSLDSTAITDEYQPINADGLPYPCFFMRIVNGGTKAITISYDGVHDNEQILAGDSFDFPTPLNTLPNSRGAQWAAGTIIYVTGSAGASGVITLSGYYQQL